jgi:putative flippase GtrA
VLQASRPLSQGAVPQLSRARARARASVTLAPAPAAPPRVPLGSAYIKSQVVAALATLTDFACMVFLVEVAHIHYVASTALGLLAGGAMAFLSNRHWSFRAGHLECGGQVVRYAMVWLGSLILTCGLVFVMTDHAGLSYMASKALTAIAVGACFNFPMHRFYVFAERPKRGDDGGRS